MLAGGFDSTGRGLQIRLMQVSKTDELSKREMKSFAYLHIRLV